jgi:hypothetical protein
MRSFSHNHITKLRQKRPGASVLQHLTSRNGALPLSRYHIGGLLKSACRLSIALLMGLLMSLTAHPQSADRVQGTVTDEKGTTLPGVSIAIKGTTTGTLTDANGRFTIIAGTGTTLVVTMVGYKPAEVIVGSQKTSTVGLTPATSSLNEVVVVGYGTQKKV